MLVFLPGSSPDSTPTPPSPAQAVEGMETGGVVDVPDTPDRTIHSETNISLVGRSICSDMILEVSDTPDRLASQQAGGSDTHVQNSGVSNRLRGSDNVSSIVGKSPGLETNLVDFDLPSRGENFVAVDGIKKSDATQSGTLKLSKMNARKHEASVASSRDKFIEASSSNGSPCVSIISANCEIKKGNWKKAIVSSGEVSHVGTKGRNNKITHQRFAAENATSSRDNDPLGESFDFQARYAARNKHNGAPSFGTNKLASDRICPKVGVVIGTHSRSNDRGACGTHDGSSTSKHNVDLPRILLARDLGKEVHFDGNSQVGSVQNGSVPLESRKYGQRKLVRNGRISPNNIVNELCPFELIGKINRDGDVGTTWVNDDRAKDKGKGVDRRTAAVNGGVVKERHSLRHSPVPKLDELFRTAELMRGSGSSDNCLEHKPASSSINIHWAGRRGISNGNHGMVEEEASRVDLRSLNTSHEPRKHHSQNGHPHNASSSSMADEDFQMEGQNRLLLRMKRQCTSFSDNNGESSAFSSVHSFSAGMLSARGCSGSFSNLGPIIEIDESSFFNGERCDRSHDNNNRNDDSEERARQIEADEELARQLQEEIYNENSEIDRSIALLLQQEENSRAISIGGHDVSSPIGVSRAPFYRHRSSTQNTSRLANRVHGAASTRIARMRRNLVVYPRRASYSRRSIECPDSMGLDMRLDILEAMEATLPITNPLFHVQRDFDENDFEMLLALDDENHRSSGASVQQINSLPQSIVQSENCEEACAVCLENPSKGDTIRHLPCLHKFHKDCIDPWLARKPSCPVCKSGIT